jgi:hypothetical protein
MRSRTYSSTASPKRRRNMGEARRRYVARDGVARRTLFDSECPDGFVIHTAMDVEPVLDSIARDREIMPNNGVNKLLGRLPMIVVEDLIRRGIYDDRDAFDRWWNTIEANPWRIWGGRI